MSKQTIRYTPPESETMPLFYFVVTGADSATPLAVEVEDKPADATEANSSILVVSSDVITRSAGFHITWYPHKPAATAGARNPGLLAVIKCVRDQLPPDMQAYFDQMTIGIGHADGAQAHIIQ